MSARELEQAMIEFRARKGNKAAASVRGAARATALGAINISAPSAPESAVSIGLKVASNQVELAAIGCNKDWMNDPLTFNKLIGYYKAFSGKDISPEVAAYYGFDDQGTPTAKQPELSPGAPVVPGIDWGKIIGGILSSATGNPLFSIIGSVLGGTGEKSPFGSAPTGRLVAL